MQTSCADATARVNVSHRLHLDTPVNDVINLLPVLRRYWGYATFRPMQERVVRSLLGGRDTCVVMPTGGGKSLCYQMPAAISEGSTAIVISPLIALMQDQVAQLLEMGISAALLNSSLAGEQQSEVLRKALQGAYRLLYLSPERIARADTLEWLHKIPISFFVIDEAHCISEWGHEFRPEYRQLSKLRREFPDQPIAAFTASATQQVRHDIVAQLQLRDAHKYIASFHRPNLRYIAKECTGKTQNDLLMRALRRHAGSNVIIYAPTIDRVEETVDFLEEQGIPSIGYHGKMDSATRRRNQESWMSDEVRVLVGTIAFGLGINKAAVRAVIHLSLPKSIEQYYQEAGRAGRDGLEADCVLLWQKRDAGLLAYFIGQMNDAAEKQRAWTRYHRIREFAESKTCRHRQICSHFGEKAKWISCGACDVCTGEPEWLAPKASKRKVPRKAAGTSAAAPSKRSASAAIDAEMRERAEAHTPGKKTSRGAAASGSILNEPNRELAEYLREWRRQMAKEQDVPAFVVLHDTTLEQLCQVRPASKAELLRVSGIGERKAELYGAEILATLKRFAEGARATVAEGKKATPREETVRLLAEGRSFAEIAEIRGRLLGSVVGLVSDLVASGEVEFERAWVAPDKVEKIEGVCAKLGWQKLAPVKEALPPEVTYDEIRLVTARLRWQEERENHAKNTIDRVKNA